MRNDPQVGRLFFLGLSAFKISANRKIVTHDSQRSGTVLGWLIAQRFWHVKLGVESCGVEHIWAQIPGGHADKLAVKSCNFSGVPTTQTSTQNHW